MSQYIAVEVSTSMTWTFNSLTIINDLIFAYFLHKISKRIPIPFQWEDDQQNENIITQHMERKTNNKAISLLALHQQMNKKNASTQTLQYNLHHNKYINLCHICNYKLTQPTYPSYFFDDVTPDRRKQLLENHWQTIQDQTTENRTSSTPERRKSTAPSNYGGMRLFAITAKRLTKSVFKHRSSIQYASLSLRLWSVALGIIALALSWSFWMNVLLEYIIACIFNRESYAELFGLLAVFAIIHCAMWWLKRQWQALRLLWYNTADNLSVSVAVWWRLFNLLLCLSFTLWSSIDSDLAVSDSVFWQLFLRWMVLQGLVWELGYAALCFLVNIWVVFRLYLLKYDFTFMHNLGKSHLKSIRKSINNLSGLLTADKDAKPPTIAEEKDDKLCIERQLSSADIADLSRLHEIEATQQSLLQAVQSRSAGNGWYSLLEFICALKEKEDSHKMVCCNRLRLVYIKYCYVFLLFAAVIICFSVGDEAGKSLCQFAGYMFVMYYFVVLFRRAKYNALFCFWSSKFHARFYSHLRIIYSFESHKRAESRQLSVNDSGLFGRLLANRSSFDQAAALHFSDSDESTEKLPMDLDRDHEQKSDFVPMEDEKEDTDIPQQKAKIYSDIADQEIIVFRDMNRNIFVKTMSIDYMDFWSMIELDDNDFYGCAVFCGATKELCAAICALVIVIIFVALAITMSSAAHSPTKSIYVEDATDRIIAPYPMCQADWGENNINVLDMVYLTIVAYYSKPTEIKNFFELWFGNGTNGLNGTGWQFDKIHIEPQKPAFFHISNTNGLEVVAVRGTYDMDDVLQDVSLYTEIATLQAFSWIIPLTTVLPVGFIRDFVKYASIPEGMIDPTLRDRYDEPIYDYVRDKLNGSLSTAKIEGAANKTIFIMGHSLGGGVAEIVAAKFADEGYTNVYSFGLSSPGTLWSSSKFGFSVEALDKSCVSVLPRRDPVSLVDSHGGVSQVIECNAKETFRCHLSTRSFCELYQECGTALVRNLSFTHCVCGNATSPANDWELCW